jgi:hypothetical protein
MQKSQEGCEGPGQSHFTRHADEPCPFHMRLPWLANISDIIEIIHIFFYRHPDEGQDPFGATHRLHRNVGRMDPDFRQGDEVYQIQIDS